MRDFSFQVLLPAVLLYALWTPASAAVAWALFEGYWNPASRLSNGALRMIRTAELLLMVSPPLTAAVFIMESFTSRGPYTSAGGFLGGTAAMLGPQIAFGLLVGWRIGVGERRAAGDDDPANLRQACWMKIRRNLAAPTAVGLIFSALFLVVFVRSLPVLLFAVGGPLILSALLTGLGRRSPGGGFEMEQSPLRTEISQISAQFGARTRRVLVRPARRRLPELSRPMLMPLRRGAFSDHRGAHVIPLVHFLELDPEVLTVGLAQRWARRITAGSFYGTAEVGTGTRIIVTAGAAGFGCIVVPIAVGLSVVIFGSFHTSLQVLLEVLGLPRLGSGITNLCFFLAAGGAVAGAVYLMVRSLGGFPTHFEFHKNAFRAWSGTEPPGTRYLPEYAVAATFYLAYSRAIRNPELVLLHLRRDDAFVRLLETGPPGTAEESWNAVHHALATESQGPGPSVEKADARE